jgi:hypothetical protein
MLDLLFIASLSKACPKPKNLEETHYLICSGFVAICVVWNAFCFFFIAKRVFPNFWFERGLVLTADCLGHCYTGTSLSLTVYTVYTMQYRAVINPNLMHFSSVLIRFIDYTLLMSLSFIMYFIA